MNNKFTVAVFDTTDSGAFSEKKILKTSGKRE